MRPLEGPQAPFSGHSLPTPARRSETVSNRAGRAVARRIGTRSGPVAAGVSLAALNLIHTTNSPNPTTARAAARFDAPEGLPLGLLDSRCPLSFLIGFRAGQASQPKPTL
jgi:hypothetical protein